MDPTRVTSGAKAAISTLKDAYAVGQEGGKFISDVQQDSLKIVAQQQKQRELERKKQDKVGSYQEQKAYKKFLEDRESAKASANLKDKIIKDHGPKGWDDFLKAQADIKRIDTEDAKNISKDTAKINALFWYCMIAGVIIAYTMYATSQ